MIGQWILNYAKPFLPQSQFFGMLPPDAIRWSHSQFILIFPMQNMEMTVQQCPTPTGTQQRPTNNQQILPLQINTEGIPVYQIDASVIQSLLTHKKMTVMGDPQGIAQESNTYMLIAEFKVSEGENQRMKKIGGLEDTAGGENSKRYKDILQNTKMKKTKHRSYPQQLGNATSSIMQRSRYTQPWRR